MIKLTGTLTQIKSRISLSGDKTNTITLTVFGDIPSLHALMEKPLSIELAEG